MPETRLVKNVRENGALRSSFSALAQRVFGISFEGWYRRGYWGEAYRPYVLAEGETVLAGAAANLMDLRWDGEVHRCIQIGTVMTAPEARGRGLSRRLLEELLRDWAEDAELVYLFANATAPVSYTHLEVYKRQDPGRAGAGDEYPGDRPPPPPG